MRKDRNRPIHHPCSLQIRQRTFLVLHQNRYAQVRWVGGVIFHTQELVGVNLVLA